MKIRNGFVSNSSSSSFCIIGKYYKNIELEKLLELKGLSEERINDIISDNWVDCDEVISELLGKDSDLEGYHMSDCDDTIIGYDIYKLNKYNDLTFIQFKEKIANELKKIDPTIAINDLRIEVDCEFDV